MSAFSDQAYITLLRLLPKSTVSSLVGRLARVGAPVSMHQAALRMFIKSYGIDVSEVDGEVTDFATFADFFSRPLKPGMRPIDASPDALVSPVDGRVSQVGSLDGEGMLVQAKGITFPAAQLLGDEKRAQEFLNGEFVTLYLSPRDYHRFHSPIAGQIEGYTYLPGKCWPVNASAVRTIDALYAVNERLVTWLSTPRGLVAFVAVGATCVARIRAAYDDVVTNTGGARASVQYPSPKPCAKGDLLGAFELGSTVIALFPKGTVAWDSNLQPGVFVRCGERIGSWR